MNLKIFQKNLLHFEKAIRKLIDSLNLLKSFASNTVPRRHEDTLNRYVYVLERLGRTSRITSDDIEGLRKEAVASFSSCSTNSTRMLELKKIIQLINAIPLTSKNSQYLMQYQYIVNWYYCQLRFISSPLERRRLFKEAKAKYRKIFDLLKDTDIYDKLPSYLHWSQLCYEYAELADDESLIWCKEGISCASANLTASSSRNSTLSLDRDNISLIDSLSSYTWNRKQKYISDTLEYIRDNVSKIETIMYSSGSVGIHESLMV
uniref:CHAD domain-containing protein n=1 Tax=Syphacia muris TaxID=451379 RepID=A0A0N5AXN3_9BILA